MVNKIESDSKFPKEIVKVYKKWEKFIYIELLRGVKLAFIFMIHGKLGNKIWFTKQSKQSIYICQTPESNIEDWFEHIYC